MPTHRSQGQPDIAYGYQPPVFPDNEQDVSVPSAHDMIRRCRHIWTAQEMTGSHLSAGPQSVAKDLHMKVPSKKLVPQFLGPFNITRVVGPAAV